jgi:hypothetical protein
MDVNEEIVKTWLHVCKKYFTIGNIPFVIKRKLGSNYGDIDILAVDRKGRFYDYEIKGMIRYSLGKNDYEWLFDQLVNKEREKKVRSIIGNKPYQKVLVARRGFFGGEKKHDKLIKILKQKGVKVEYLDDIVNQLVEIVDKTGPKSDSPALQIIRLLKYCKIIDR